MAKSNWVALKCKLSKGIFSSERAFVVTLANGERHSGPAPLHFCWNSKGQPLGEKEAINEEIDGWVAARQQEQPLPGDQVAVEVPDAQVLAVRRHQIRAPWTEIVPPTPATT
jgi:hypothetical protein